MIKQLLTLIVTIPFLAGISYAQNNGTPVGHSKSTVNFTTLGVKQGTVTNNTAEPTHTSGEKCLQNSKTEALKASSPEFRLAFDQARETTRRIASELASGERAAPPVYTIPVVFHIIHKGESVGSVTNISAAQIESAVDALNRDFRRTSDDGGIAQGAGPDTEIQFCLAGVAPNGSPHSGINRVNGTGVSGYSGSGITNSNEENVKDLSRWDNRYYLNVWVVSEIDGNGADVSNVNSFFGGTIGYAYQPTNPVTWNADRDGIVILNLSVGNDPTGSQGFRLWGAGETNRTLTHEVGHFLALDHTFHNTGGCSENNCNTDGDGICDTPVTVQGSSCNNPTCNNTQVENYMDYTSESCQDQFTTGQSNVMRAVLSASGARNELVNTSNCGASSVNYDAGISAITTPNGALCITNFTPVVTLNNYGSTTLTSVNIQYYVDGNSPTTYNWSGSLGSNSAAQVTLNAMTTTAGGHTFTARTASNTLNGSNSDQETGNDQTGSSFTVGAGGSEVNITVELDCWGAETTWEITNGGGSVVAFGGPYTNNLPDGDGPQVASACLAEGCYDFTINDTEADGLFGSQWTTCNVDGAYQITDGNGAVIIQMIATQGDFGASETQNFCMGTPTTTTCEELFNYNGQTYTVNATDEPSFTASFFDVDQEDVNVDWANAGYTSNWMTLFEEPTPLDTNWFAASLSYHDDITAPADNWINFGPITMLSDGGEVSWRHRYSDNLFRDGYEVLVGTVGTDPADFGAATTLFSVSDNDASTDGHTDWVDYTIDLPAGAYANQQLYFALHHNALDMFLLNIDDIIIEGCSSDPLAIAENESINLTVYPNPSSENFIVSYSNNSDDNLSFSVYNAVGQEVWSKSNSTRGTSVETIDTGNLSSGVYTLVVRGTNLNESKRLILTK
ncbi:MAG: hypothetical protein ACI9UR_002373 [Bacteroidia bacterium]|jgi:hypothetical protein